MTLMKLRPAHSMSSRLRITLSICLVAICILATVFSYFTARSIADFAIEGAANFSAEASAIYAEQASATAIQRIAAEARIKAAAVEARLDNAMGIVTTLAESLSWSSETGSGARLSRTAVSLRLKRLLMNNPHLVSVYTCWEQGAFTQPGEARPADRFTANWQRLPDGTIRSAPLLDFDSTLRTKQGVRRGEFHILSRETHTPHFITLHPYRLITGETWLTTATAPIMVNDTFMGSIGVSFTVDSMHQMMQALKDELYDGVTDAFIVTASGHVVTGTVDSLASGTHLSTFTPDWQEWLKDIAAHSPSALLIRDNLIITIPLALSGQNQPAAMLISVPARVINQEALTLQDTLTSEMGILTDTILEQRDFLIWRQMGIGILLMLVTLLIVLLLRTVGLQGKALHESEKQVREILMSTSNVVHVKDTDGIIRFANPSFARLFGLPAETIVGRHESEVLPPALLEVLRQHDQATLLADKPMQWEETLDSDGSNLIFLTTKFPLHRTTGETYGICSIAVDISERSRSEQRILQMERYLADIIDSMPSAIIGVDEGGRVRHWNLQAAAIFAISKEEAVGRPLLEIAPALTDEWARVQTTLAADSPFPAERTSIRLANGETMHARIVVYPLHREDGVEVVIRLDDRTAQIRIEEMMIQTEKMLSIGGLAAGMAHEINNPLGAILQGAQNIERRLSPDIPGNVQTATAVGCDLDAIAAYFERRKISYMLRGIREAGERAARIVQNMLNFSRKSESIREAVAIPDIVERTIEMARSDYDLKKRYDIKQVQITTQFNVDLPAISCIATEIEQVLLNLFKNAAQAIAMREDAPRNAAHIHVAAHREGTEVELTVEDNGPGMDEPTRRRIFEPFFTTKAPGMGTGLGLSVTYFIITENHGGSISVESEPGKGTRFIIRLPIKGHTPKSGV